jgi:uncharacterized protein (DUF2249 family)
MMTNDPTLDRIREVRRQISAECDHDPKQLIAHYQELEQRHPERFIQLRKEKISNELPV